MFLVQIRDTSIHFTSVRTGTGSMDYGKDTQSYILMKIWFTLLALVTLEQIGFSLM
uniref:Uncharacterized protein n=1 Tax=Rhizophora mucronata TaxID=61149 RepID=A0A2P2J6X0_RHIMU